MDFDCYSVYDIDDNQRIIVKRYRMNEQVWYLGVMVMNGIGFVLMGSDKQRAIRHEWRIPEKTLLGVAIFGGSLGILTGMFVFHHKTNKALFFLGIPIILGLQALLILQLL